MDLLNKLSALMKRSINPPCAIFSLLSPKVAHSSFLHRLEDKVLKIKAGKAAADLLVVSGTKHRHF